MEDSGFKITIIGMGLIGASYAEALMDAGFSNLYGVDLDEKVLKEAEGKKIIAKGFVSAEAPLKEADLVIISIYPKETINFVKNNLQFFKSGAVITDTAGLKSEIVKNIKSLLPETLDFVGGHPMAGREGKGINMASKDIFKSANYILTPVEANKAESIELIEKLAIKIGCKNVIQLSPEEHDKIIAFTSQLPHILAVLMMNNCSYDKLGDFIGNGFRDVTRIAVNNSELWSELFIENGQNIITALECIEKELSVFKQSIIQKDKEKLIEKLESANIRRREIK